ncbi:MAG: isochorismate synthase MenF [Thermoflexales bacterium]
MSEILQWVEPIPLRDFAPIAMLHLAQSLPRLLFYNGHAQVGGAAIGCAARLTVQRHARFVHVAEAARRFTVRGERPLLWMGGGAFWPHPPADADWQGFSATEWILPRVVVWRDGEHAYLLVHQPTDEPGHPRDLARTWTSRLRDVANLAIDLPSAVHADVHMQPPFSAWEADLAQALHAIRSGAIQKVVLARQLRLTFATPPNPIHALQRLWEAYPTSFLFYVQLEPSRAFLGATPERLIAVRARRFETMALAGSIRRGRNAAEDMALAQALLESAKNRHEHRLVVESICNRLASLSNTLEVDASPRVMQLGNIQHLQTCIRGTLRDGQSALHLTQLLHPTPAVGGMPQEMALAQLAELERIARGWYAGPVGWFTSEGDGEIAVALRSALLYGHTAIAYGGAGIVADSDPLDEWRETALKMRPMLEALCGDRAPHLLERAMATDHSSSPTTGAMRAHTPPQQECCP